MDRRHVIRLSVLVGLLSSAGTCTPFETPRPRPDAAPSDASSGADASDGTGGGSAGGAGGVGGSGAVLLRVGFETLAPAATTGGAIQLVQQRLSPGSSVTCNTGICFSGGIEP